MPFRHSDPFVGNIRDNSGIFVIIRSYSRALERIDLRKRSEMWMWILRQTYESLDFLTGRVNLMGKSTNSIVKQGVNTYG